MDATTFWAKVKIGSERECWPWQASKSPGGYGRTGSRRLPYNAHRAAWLFIYGEIPRDMLVLHYCDNPSCCNPMHLWLGTQKDNLADMTKKGRRRFDYRKTRGENNYNAKLATHHIDEIRHWLDLGYSQEYIARNYAISQTHVSRIKLKKTWKHIS